MKNNSLTLLALVSFVIGHSLVLAQAGIETGPSFKSVTNELSPKYGRVRFHREEAFEDDFVMTLLPRSVFLTRPHFFLVQAEGFDISTDPVARRAGNRLPTMYLATSADEKTVYRLGGFPEAESNFNRMVRAELNQRVTNRESAESRGLLCATTVYLLSPTWWIDGEGSFRSQLARHFIGISPGAPSARWKKHVDIPLDRLNITTEKKGDSYFIHLPVFWGPAGSSNVEIREYKIEVEGDGSCHTPNTPFRVTRYP